MANKLELIFLGTSSAMPSKTRNVSSLALRINDGDSAWLFDCGEGTQHQIIRTEKLKLTKVTKIFITHNHGDHVFGVFGLLLTASGIQGSKEPRFQLVGPKGLRQLIRTALSLTHSRLAGSYRVDELLFPDDLSSSCGEEGKLECEEVGYDIRISEDGFWHIPQDDDRFEDILAAPIEHSIPTVGFVINEKPIPGSLNPDLIKPRLMAAKAEFASKMGIKNPMALLSKLKNGEEIIFPDGSKVLPQDVIGAPKPGRKIVILGDTSNPLPISPISQGCDVIVHEATNSMVGEGEGTNENELEESTRCHGHSTPQMAGSFAASIGAKHLILNHFSSRYKGDDSAESLAVMNQIKQLAISTFLSEEVSTANDLFTYNIPRNLK